MEKLLKKMKDKGLTVINNSKICEDTNSEKFRSFRILLEDIKKVGEVFPTFELAVKSEFGDDPKRPSVTLWYYTKDCVPYCPECGGKEEIHLNICNECEREVRRYVRDSECFCGGKIETIVCCKKCSTEMLR